MTNRILLGPVPLLQAGVSVNSEQRQRQNLAQQGFLSSSGSRVESLTTDPSAVSLSGRLRPPIPVTLVPLLADEIEELAAGDIGPLSLTTPSNTDRRKLNGYYHIEDASVQPPHPSRRGIQRYDVSLTRAGGRGSHYRAVRTQPQSIDNPVPAVSADPVIPIYLPVQAQKRQLYNPDSGATTGLDATSQVDSAIGTLAAITSSELSSEERLVLYDASYTRDISALYVFDDRGFSSKTDGNDNRQWQAVFDPSHDLEGQSRFVVSTQRLRVYLTGLTTPDIEAEEYSAGSWSSISIPTTDWEILDVDLRRVGLHSASVQLRLQDTTNISDVRTVNLYFAFGDESITVGVPPTESSTIPPGITDRLEPIARSNNSIIQPERTLVPKREVRK